MKPQPPRAAPQPSRQRPARSMAAVLLLAALGAALVSCGQKGSLYLPDQKKSKVPAAAQPMRSSPQPAPSTP